MNSVYRALAASAALGVLAAAVPTANAQGGFGGPPGGPGRGGGGPGSAETKLVKQFDKDGDKRLNTAERADARAYLAANPGSMRGGPGGGRGGPGGPGGRGGPGGPGGRGGFGRGNDTTPPVPGKHVAPSDVKSAGNAPIYDLNTVRTFFIDFEGADWEKELEAFNNTDVDVPAKVTVDGKTYRDVGVHFRGMSSYFSVPTGRKRSLNLSFDYAVDTQKLGGYASYNLLNSNGDPSLMRAVLFSQIARTYTPTPKTNFVRVVINGEFWGIYANAQQFNSDFTRENYNSTGARWKVPGSPQGRGGLEYLGDNAALYKSIYEIKSKDDTSSWNALIAFTKTLNETAPEQLEAALKPIFDIDGALKFLALENVFVNEDGYWIRASDYSIYRDPKGVFHVVAHDDNEVFPSEGGPGGRGRGGPGMGGPPGMAGGPPMGANGGPPDGGRGGFGGRGGPGGPGGGRGGMGNLGPKLDPLTGADNAARPLLSKLLAVPALRTRYLGYERDIADKWLDWNTLGPIATNYQKMIAKDVYDDTRKLDTNEAFDSSVTALKKFADERREFLLNNADVKKATGR